jgi:uncharacterized protein (DUF1800 family)
MRDNSTTMTAPKTAERTTRAAATTVLTGIAPYTGVWGKDQIVHLLKRTMFGAKPADVDYFSTRTLAQTIQTLLAPTGAPTNLPIKAYGTTAATNYDLNVAVGATWVNDGEVPNANGQRTASLKSWWLYQMLTQERSLQEKMTLFWHNHFATELANNSALNGYVHNTMLRRNALGNFKTFVKEVTIDPLMLFFLNGRLNVRNAPDENYGRELQELFTMGKGPNSQYTEDDVKAAAKVLTGWSVTAQTDTAPVTTTFTQNRHDTTNKTFSAFYGGRIITGRTGTTATTDGRVELDDLLTMLFANNELALFICRKLYTFFVYYEITPDVETNVIAPLATIFRSGNYEIRPVLEALFSSQHFYDVAQKGCLIKSPIEFLVGSLREFNVALPPLTSNYLELYKGLNWLAGLSNNYIGITQMQQDLGDPPNVAGWPAYYQTPQFHEIWINSDSLPKRLTFIDAMLNGTGWTLGSGFKLRVVPTDFTLTIANAQDPNLLIENVLAIFYRIPVTQRFKDSLKSILLSGQATDAYWTDAWNTWLADRTNVTKLNIVTTRLTSFYKILVDQPEYQLA